MRSRPAAAARASTASGRAAEVARAVTVAGRRVDVPWTLLDRVITHFDPRRGGARLQARLGHALLSEGYSGASSSRRSLAGYNPLAQDADADIVRDLPTLRARSRDMERNAPVAGAALNTVLTNVVGTGLSLQAQIDREYLGLSEDAAKAWKADAERRFGAWADSADCDLTRTQNFYALQGLALRTVLASGDGFVPLLRVERPGRDNPLTLQLIEADRCCNPDRKPDSSRQVQGVEMDADGAPVAYSFASRHPYGAFAPRGITWQTIPAFGAESGRRNVLHLFERRRPGQTRGVPYLAPVIEPLKQLERYTNAELMAAVVSGMFTVFLETESTAQILPSAIDGGTGQGASAAAGDVSLGNGLIMELAPGERANVANPGRPNAQFEPFVTAVIRQIGMLLEIPYELLVKHYQSSYSAAKAAMNDAWRFFRCRREWLATALCQPVYEAFLEEEIASGRLQARGFFSDPLARAAWCGAEWVGDGPGSLDPLKEALAARERVDLTISTLERESILHDGGSWQAKVQQRGREEAQRQAHQLGPTAPASVPPDSPAPASPAARSALVHPPHGGT